MENSEHNYFNHQIGVNRKKKYWFVGYYLQLNSVPLAHCIVIIVQKVFMCAMSGMMYTDIDYSKEGQIELRGANAPLCPSPPERNPE